MFRGDWGKYSKIAGLAALILIGSLFTYAATIPYGQSLKQEAANKASIERDNAEYTIKWVCSSPLAEKDCVTKTRQAENENARNAEDLGAQKLSAWWAQVMAVAALIGMALSAVGVWLVKTTFDETRKANEHSEDALIHAKKMAQLELRPYVQIEQISCGKDRHKAEVRIKVKNFGLTPATEFSIEAGSGFEIPTSDRVNVRLRECRSDNAILPGKTIEIIASGMTPLFPDMENRLFCSLNFKYQDRFGGKYGIFQTYMKRSRTWDDEPFEFYHSP
ncbi:MAG: hypothetical protein ACRCVX_13310 [Shewanella sp.]